MASNVPTTLTQADLTTGRHVDDLVNPISSEAQELLDNFWPKVNEDIQNINVNDFKTQELPLARIKKIMKLDEDVKMISAEAPVLFAKAAEIFISELSLRAWIHTEDNKRRTLQKNDVSQAVAKYDQFDFLIDIVPRDEIKPAKRDENIQRAGMMPDQVQYYFQLAQQTQQALQNQQAGGGGGAQQLQANGIQVIQAGGQQVQQTAASNVITLSQPTTTQASAAQPQIIQISAPPTPQPPATPASVMGDDVAQTTQVFQQVVDSSGQVVNMPITLTQEQLQAIQAQMQGKQPGQPIVIHTQSQNDDSEQPQPLFQVHLSQEGPRHFIQDTDLEHPVIHKQEQQ